MISQIIQNYTLTPAQDQILQALLPWDATTWSHANVNLIKETINTQLLTIQGSNCCYCGLRVNETGRGEVDHIAKKGGPKRPAYVEFTFTPNNLAIACQYCNSSSKKGQEDVLDHVDLTNYNNCTFKIVHPYFDNPGNHYQWSHGRFRILITGLSKEAKFSIQLFELDSEAHTMARAKQEMFERKLRQYQNYQAIKQRIISILNFV